MYALTGYNCEHPKSLLPSTEWIIINPTKKLKIIFDIFVFIKSVEEIVFSQTRRDVTRPQPHEAEAEAEATTHEAEAEAEATTHEAEAEAETEAEATTHEAEAEAEAKTHL